ncbi:hypothetical protein [Streptomyces sp. 2231.1]|uniref:hypothetical protein n=1 Tax=Streptomyces sp. 2231.1 TaxID=1855347 RepID=UPI000D1C1FC2|nr:hypothetical protein [Streptomyces sp. 2231.1]
MQPDDPIPYRPEEPSPSAWQRGGQVWALALGTVPHQEVLDHLAARFTAPQQDGLERLRAGAMETLNALAVTDSPARAERRNSSRPWPT